MSKYKDVINLPEKITEGGVRWLFSYNSELQDTHGFPDVW